MHTVAPRRAGLLLAAIAFAAFALMASTAFFAPLQKAEAASAYTINYHLNGGTNPLSQYRSIAAGKTMKTSTLKKPTKTGYTFKGWFTSSKLKTAAKTISGTSSASKRTIYAKWSPISYKIVYNLNDGAQAKGQKTSYTIETATFKLKSPTRNGYVFKGWCTSASLTNESIVSSVKKGSTGKIILYAKWKESWNGDVSIPGVNVKSTVSDYSWSELSLLSSAIAKTESQDDALKIAIHYHLCSATGKLTGSERKEVTYCEGTSEEIKTSVQIVGFRHDVVDEDRVAGITFIFCDALKMMMPEHYTALWAGSNLRKALQDDIIRGLPNDLTSQIVEVQKLTNSYGKYPVPSADYVVPTQEKLWLFSLKELEGTVDQERQWRADFWSGDPEGFMIFPKKEIAVYNAEGEQYQLFKDAGIDERNACNPILARTYKGERVSWLLRTTDPEFFYFAHVNGEDNKYALNTILGGFSNYAEKALVPGFCI